MPALNRSRTKSREESLVHLNSQIGEMKRSALNRIRTKSRGTKSRSDYITPNNTKYLVLLSVS